MTAVGHVDGFEGCYVVGWANDGSDDCEITICSDDGIVVAKGRTERDRPDPAVLGDDRTDIAFRIGVPDLASFKRLHVFGNGIELRNSPIEVGAGLFDGFIHVRQGSVSGWVTERTSEYNPPLVRIVDQDGQLLAEVSSKLDGLAADPMFQPARFVAELDQACFTRGELLLRALVGDRCFASTSCILGLEGRVDVLQEEPEQLRVLERSRTAALTLAKLSPDRRLRDLVNGVTIRQQKVNGVPPEPPPASEPPSSDAIEQWRRAIQMHCDQAILYTDGTLSVSGWAVCATGIAALEVHLDGEMVGEAELGRSRVDVAREYPAIAMARFAGFEFSQRVRDHVDSTHQVVLVARNGLDDTRAETRVVTAAEVPSPPLALLAASASASAADRREFRLEVDKPAIKDGSVVNPVVGRLIIEGWSLAASAVVGVEVYMDDEPLGAAHYGLVRRDVSATFPDNPNALRAGYVFHCPARSLRDGEHTIRVVARAADGEVASRHFAIEVSKAEDAFIHLRIRREIPPLQAELYADVLDRLDHRPAFQLILRQTESPDTRSLETTLQSLVSQAYDNWRLIVPPDALASIRALCAALSERAPNLSDRVEAVADLDRFAFPPGYYGVLSPGDELGADALAEIAAFGGLHRGADLIYADESRISPVTREQEPFFKPDFSPDLLLSSNYIGRPWFASADLLRAANVASDALRRGAEYDLVLRLAENARQIRHLPKLLCCRAPPALDTPAQEEAALDSMTARRGIVAEILPGCVTGTWRLRRTSAAHGLVSIIIPTCAAKGYIKTCIETLRARTAYRDYEIIGIDNIPATEPAWKTWLAENADEVVTIDGDFNWARFNNQAAQHAEGEYLLFLNDDIEIIDEGWLDAMLEHARRPEVGIVGARLLYPDQTVQHAGMFLSSLGVARHAFRRSAAADPCYFGLALTQRNVMAVTGACMLVRRESYDALGGFDETHAIVNNDLDYCLRAHEAGLLTVYTPYATLIHHELASREKLDDVYDTTHFNTRWKSLFVDGDPYHNPRLSRQVDNYHPDEEPTQEIFAGHPHYRREEIRRILVVKLDHIGDFITAIPAIRRLKSLFPAATLHILASRSVGSLVAMESCIDGHIEFDFFHMRSSLGQKELGEEEFLALRERLRPYQFDLAIDLRRHMDTRVVLPYTSARLLAGYDHAGTCSFLDIALEWEPDTPLVRKRAHVSDGLINLVDTVGTAFETQRIQLTLPEDQRSKNLHFLPRAARRLFKKPVVAVQPGVGNPIRQWPSRHFAELIDLLVRRSSVNIVLIGGPDEQQLADEVLAEVGQRDEVMSLIGKIALGDLPRLLAACALYVGNNTGPKHIAAGLGVPTIGIHSGVVDAVEWGPLGKRAIALQRNMICSPCYYEAPSDCPRDLACMKQLEPVIVHDYCALLLAKPAEFPALRAIRSIKRHQHSRPRLQPRDEAVVDDDAA